MKKKPYRYVLYFLLLAVRRIFSLLPYESGIHFGAWVGRRAFGLLKKEREKTLGNLRAALSTEKSEKEIYGIGERVFENFGRMAAELALMEKMIPRMDKLVTTQGYEHLDKGLKDGKGIIITTAHFGNWEVMGGYSTLRGYPLTVIARRIYYEKYDQLLVSLRDRMKVKTIYRDSSVKDMLRVLKNNGILGFVVDQDVDSVDGVFVEFFGKPAYTPTAPVRFALATGAPIIPALVVRRNGLYHHVIVEPPIALEIFEDKEKTLLVNTQKWVKIQERYIREYPECWVWNHRRWKTRPKEEKHAG